MTYLAEIGRMRHIQALAKDVLVDLAAQLRPDDSEQSVVHRAKELLARRGISQTWYHSCPALVLLGSRSCLSLSGRHYLPTAEVVGDHNLVTVDLSPLKEGVCGDYARSFFVENGRVTDVPDDADFAVGQRFLRQVHRDMMRYVRPSTTMHELFIFSKQCIEDARFENLDFHGNVGHSMPVAGVRHSIEEGNQRALGDVGPFTFEPHVRQKDGRWGFKHENIYFFRSSGEVEEL